MATATAVLRIKRSLEDEPLEAFILSCKKRKPNTEVEDAGAKPEELSTILRFAGTIKEDENVLNHLKQRVSDVGELKCHYKKHEVNITKKLRAEHLEKSKTNRYKVVNCFRSQSLEDNLKQDADKSTEVTVFDVETDLNANDTTTEDQNKKSNKYVYDLYYTNSDDFGDAEIDEYVSVHPVLHDHLYFASPETEPLSEDDSEDSNAENNWRNEYPDEDDMQSITEDDMVAAMKNIAIGDDLLSSEEEEEGFVYSIDSEAAGFEEDIDESDVHRYGERYARFKAKNTKIVESTSLSHDLYCGDIDENEYYY